MGVKASLSFGLLENFLGEMEEEKRERDVAADLRVDTTSTPRVGTTEQRRMRLPELARERSLHTRTPPARPRFGRGLSGPTPGSPRGPGQDGASCPLCCCRAWSRGARSTCGTVASQGRRSSGQELGEMRGGGRGPLLSACWCWGALGQGGFAVPLPAKGSPRMSEASPLCAVRPGGRISFALHSSLHSFHLQAFGCPLALGIGA